MPTPKRALDWAFPLAVALFLPVALAYWPFKVDDAYISFVYTKNLVEGHGLTYNGLVVEGYSNFLWTVLLAPAVALHVEPLLAARLFNLALAAGCLWLLNQLLQQLIPNLSWPLRLLALLTCAVSAPFAAWSMGGLETMLFTFLVTLFVYVECRATPAAPWVAALVVLATALTRPEGAMLFPLWLVYELGVRRVVWRPVLAGAALFIGPFGLFLAWRYATYGYLVPNTAYLKLEPGVATALGAAQWLLSYLALRPLFALSLVGGLAMLLWARRRADVRWLLVVAVVAAFVAFVLYAGADWMPHHRYLTPVTPLLGLLAALSLSAVRRPWLRWGARVLALAAVGMELTLTVIFYGPLSAEFGAFTDGLVRGGQWVRENTQPGETIAVVDAGALAYYSERPVIDVLGLNNAHIAHTPRENHAAYVLAQQPVLIQLHVAFTPSGEILPPTTHDHNLDIFEHSDFTRYYRPNAASAVDPYFPFFFLRVDEPVP